MRKSQLSKTPNGISASFQCWQSCLEQSAYMFKNNCCLIPRCLIPQHPLNICFMLHKSICIAWQWLCSLYQFRTIFPLFQVFRVVDCRSVASRGVSFRGVDSTQKDVFCFQKVSAICSSGSESIRACCDLLRQSIKLSSKWQHIYTHQP